MLLSKWRARRVESPVPSGAQRISLASLTASLIFGFVAMFHAGRWSQR